jgi:hypothetical protein
MAALVELAPFSSGPHARLLAQLGSCAALNWCRKRENDAATRDFVHMLLELILVAACLFMGVRRCVRPNVAINGETSEFEPKSVFCIKFSFEVRMFGRKTASKMGVIVPQSKLSLSRSWLRMCSVTFVKIRSVSGFRKISLIVWSTNSSLPEDPDVPFE